MKRHYIILFTLIAASGIGAYYLGSTGGSEFGAYYFGSKTAEAPNAPPEQVISGLAIDGSALDLGEAAEQSDYLHNLEIHNRNERPTEIFGFGLSCSCIEGVEPPTLIIGPGATATVRLKLNLAKRNYGEQGLAKRPFDAEIRPILEKTPAAKSAAWRLHGVIASRATLDTLFLDYGDAPVHAQSPVARKVIPTVYLPDATLQTSINPEILTIKVKRMDGPAATFELTVAPAPTLPVGPFSCIIQVDLITKDGERLPGVVLSVAGKMQPEVRAIPAQLAFGPRRVGQTAESTVTLQVPPGEDWVVDHIEIDSADVRVDATAGPDAPNAPGYSEFASKSPNRSINRA